MHWAEQYVGLPFEDGVLDCGIMVERAMKEQFNRIIKIPSSRAAGLRGKSRQIRDYLASNLTLVTDPIESDGVLMVTRGSLQHVGLYCEINSEAYVLHAMRSAGQVCLHRLRSLAPRGIPVEGFYRWI